jgi:hypothetical protein
MKEKLQHLMIGRYGVDPLSKAMMYASIGCLIISMIFSRSNIFYLVALILLGYTYFRIFSRNITKRYEENQKFLNMRSHLLIQKNQKKTQWNQRKIYRFFSCPDCRQKVRVPRGKGKICITCPKCKHEFIKKA